MFCSSCGAGNQSSSFCTECGKALSTSMPQVNSAPVTPPFAESSPAGSLPPAAPKSGPGKALLPIFSSVGLLAVVLVFFLVQGSSSPIPGAVDACGLSTSFGLSVGDEGDSVVLDMEGEEDFFGLPYNDVMCVLSELDMPDSVESMMLSTSALDGRQTAQWDDLSASWTYHPDDGLDVIVTFNK